MGRSPIFDLAVEQADVPASQTRPNRSKWGFTNGVFKMAYASFQRTALTAFYGFRMMFRLTWFEVKRTYRYLSSEQAIALYRALWIGFLVCCCAAFWLGQQCRAIIQPVVDAIVEESLAEDSPELPTETEQHQAIAPEWWEYVRLVLGVGGASLRVCWMAIAQESKRVQVPWSSPQPSRSC